LPLRSRIAECLASMRTGLYAIRDSLVPVTVEWRRNADHRRAAEHQHGTSGGRLATGVLEINLLKKGTVPFS